MNLLNPYSLQALLDKKFPPVEWIWDGFIAKGDFVLLAGEPKIGKSLVTFLLTVFLARKKAFAKLIPPLHRRVLYIDAEMSAQTYQERLKRFDDKKHDGNQIFTMRTVLIQKACFS